MQDWDPYWKIPAGDIETMQTGNEEEKPCNNTSDYQEHG